MSPACHAWLRNKLHRWSDALGEKCVTCWPWCVSNLLLCADHKELALICLPSPYRFSTIHLNSNMSPLSPIFHVGLSPVWPIKIGPDLDRRGGCVVFPSLYESMCQGGPNMQISVGHICYMTVLSRIFPLTQLSQHQARWKDATQRQHWWDNKTVEIGSCIKKAAGGMQVISASRSVIKGHLRSNSHLWFW